MTGKGRVTISYERLRAALGFEGVTIHHIYVPESDEGKIILSLRGDSLPKVNEGENIPLLTEGQIRHGAQ